MMDRSTYTRSAKGYTYVTEPMAGGRILITTDKWEVPVYRQERIKIRADSLWRNTHSTKLKRRNFEITSKKSVYFELGHRYLVPFHFCRGLQKVPNGKIHFYIVHSGVMAIFTLKEGVQPINHPAGYFHANYLRSDKFTKNILEVHSGNQEVLQSGKQYFIFAVSNCFFTYEERQTNGAINGESNVEEDSVSMPQEERSSELHIPSPAASAIILPVNHIQPLLMNQQPPAEAQQFIPASQQPVEDRLPFRLQMTSSPTPSTSKVWPQQTFTHLEMQTNRAQEERSSELHIPSPASSAIILPHNRYNQSPLINQQTPTEARQFIPASQQPVEAKLPFRLQMTSSPMPSTSTVSTQQTENQDRSIFRIQIDISIK